MELTFYCQCVSLDLISIVMVFYICICIGVSVSFMIVYSCFELFEYFLGKSKCEIVSLMAKTMQVVALKVDLLLNFSELFVFDI